MPHLEYIDNTGAKAIVPLASGAQVSIGRNPGSTIQTANPSVSRNHGRIYLQDGTWHIKDLGSSNGTFLNDEPVKDASLKATDRVRCGDFVIAFIADDAPEGARRAEPVEAPRRSDVRAGIAESPVNATSSRVSKPELPRPEPVRDAGGRRPEARPTMAPRPASELLGAAGDAYAPPRETRSPERRPEPAPSRNVSPSGRTEGEEKLVRQIKEQGAEIETLRLDLGEHRSMVKDLELKLSDWESRAKRYEVELDSVTEKYVQLKDQLTLSKERLEDAREELEQRNDKVFQLEARLEELETEITSARERASATQEHVSGFKIKLTQKERQIEDLQRQYDLMEFELRAKKEELETLQEGFNSEAGDTAKLERRVNQLREIIADKESVISELRLELENKDIEIRQIRMGVGMSSLEDEKRKLLEDYYSKVREVDELRGKIDKSKHDRVEAEQKLREAQADADKKAQAAADFASHPEFKAKVREISRLESQLADVQTELADTSTKLGEFSPDDKKRLTGELAFYKRKSATIEEKLAAGASRVAELERQVEQLHVAAAAVVPSPPTVAIAPPVSVSLQPSREDATRELDSLLEHLEQWRGNFMLLKTYLKDVEAAVSQSPTATDPELSDPRDALDSIKDIVTAVEQDATMLRKGLQKMQRQNGT